MIRHHVRAVAAACALAASLLLTAPSAQAETRTLSFKQMHTGETLSVVYKRNGRYDQAGLKKINYMLRDWRRNESTDMDPRLLDVLWEAHRLTGSRAPIHVLSGYRAPATNDMLRSRSGGVAKNSQHTHGKALDFYLPDVPLSKLREVGLKMQRGGVGFYPTSGSPFVHLDTGSVRHWPRMTRAQLAKVFPDGKTVHMPSDGKPMPGYQVALAELGRPNSAGRPSAGSSNGGIGQLFASRRDASRPIQSASASGSGGGFLGQLFGRNRQGETQQQGATQQVAAAPAQETQAAAPEREAATVLANAPLPPSKPGPAQADVLVAASDVPLPEPRPFALAALAPADDMDGDVPLPPQNPVVTASLAPSILPPARPMQNRQPGERLSPGAMEALMALAPSSTREEELPFAATFNDAGEPPAQSRLIAIDLRAEVIDPYVLAADCLRNQEMARLSHPNQSDFGNLMEDAAVVVENRFDKEPEELTIDAFTGPAVAYIATRHYGPDLRADAGDLLTGSLN